ncbi:MAG: peptide/nickel transport system ATP-binding protein [Candidatus Omnitrophota bacterium]|jgi:peptide/nickel transport system ATP-binding protein
MTTLLEVKDVDKAYTLRGGDYAHPKKLMALNHVSLELNAKETLGLVGESGSGKSTLAKIILGIEKRTQGLINFDGQELKVWDKSVRARMQIIFQNALASLNPRMRVEDMLKEPFIVHGITPPQGLQKRCAELLASVHLDANFMNKYAHELSGGEAQRIAIARAIALNPKLLICDEAVSSLDVIVRAQIMDLLLELQDQYDMAYLFISHDFGVIRHMSDRISVMENGCIVETGPSQDLFLTPKTAYTQRLIQASFL